MALSTDSILDAAVGMIRRLAPGLRGDFLDVGAGHGRLIERVRGEFPVTARACDYRADLITRKGLGEGITVDVVNLNENRLPYPDASFDLVTCTEVIEHLEQYRGLLREAFRILKPGGVFVLTTPNILNLKSRLRFLGFGFFNLFGPLRFDDDDIENPSGHINPVGYFYIAHALRNAGFRTIRAGIDRRQRLSLVALIILWLPLRLVYHAALAKERHQYRTLTPENQPYVEEANSTDLLLGRTLVVGCRKE